VTASRDAVVSRRGAERWLDGHVWIFRADLTQRPESAAGAVRVRDGRGRALGWALWSPASEIALRLLETDPDARIDAAWWSARVANAAERRAALAGVATAWRVVHGEGDGCPSLVVDRYDRWLVVQLLSAGVEAFRTEIVEALRALPDVAGVLARHDVSVRAREGLAQGVEPLWETVPRRIEVVEHGVRYFAAPHDGQKTGAYLDQRENRVLAGSVARGHALDLFSYHGSFALHLAARAASVTAVDSSAPALARAKENLKLNGRSNVNLVEADVFDWLRERERDGARYGTIVLDPPALAKNRASLTGALRAYRALNARALRLLEPGGTLITASCSYHVSRPLFLTMLREAASAARRRVTLRATTGQPLDHPELLTVPETGYLKGALLEVA
jgi:23S rRNA (cytosine1962-C5)-methyltransferase